MGIGNIGWAEFVVILALALVFFGPRRLPEIANQLGKGLREFRKALNEVKSEIAQAGREPNQIHPTVTRPSEAEPPPSTPESWVAKPGVDSATPEPHSDPEISDAEAGDPNSSAD